MPEPTDLGNAARVRRYYDRTESRLGYTYLLGGTKHFGWYDAGDPAWRWRTAMARMEDQLAQRLALAPGSEVLDAGCGTGAVARALATRHGLAVTGVDILDWNVEQAQRRSARQGLGSRLRFEVGNYHALPFAPATFDGLYTMETLVHASDPERALAEFLRTLRPGGRLVLIEYAHPAADRMAPGDAAALARVCDLAAMPAWWQFEDGVLDGLVSAAGFQSVVTTDVTAHMLPMLAGFHALGRFPYWVARRLGKVEKAVNAMSGVEMYRHQAAWNYTVTTATRPAA